MGKLVQVLGAGIGLASEAMASRKQSSSSTSNTRTSSSASHSPSRHQDFDDGLPPSYDSVPASRRPRSAGDEKHTIDADEQDWALDDAAHPPTYEESERPAPTPEEMKNLVQSFLRKHPAPPPPAAVNPLPVSVILPQRRPRDKKRGFVRAYAPVLENAGIAHDTFLNFLDIFAESTREAKALRVVNTAAQGVGFVPSPIAMGVSTGAQVVVGVAMEIQRRTRTTSFLDEMNEKFFKPRGLYALVMTYAPDDPRPAPRVDLAGKVKKMYNAQKPGEKDMDDHVQSSINREDYEGMKKTFGNMRLSTGKTFGEGELPEAAPLIYPDLDRLPEGQKRGMGDFVADYMDRRAQANFNTETHGSRLGNQDVQFKSSIADPNHKMYNGGVINLVSGGKYDPRDRMLARKANRRGEEFVPNERKQGLLGLNIGGKRKDNFIKKAIKKNVLYLLITNLPSERELREGAEIAARAEAIENGDGNGHSYRQEQYSSQQSGYASASASYGYEQQQQYSPLRGGNAVQQGSYSQHPYYDERPQQSSSYGPQQSGYTQAHQNNYSSDSGYPPQQDDMGRRYQQGNGYSEPSYHYNGNGSSSGNGYDNRRPY